MFLHQMRQAILQLQIHTISVVASPLFARTITIVDQEVARSKIGKFGSDAKLGRYIEIRKEIFEPNIQP